MYPIIHDYAATDLTSQGYGALSDCILCEVTEELNGAFTLELQYPLHGLHAQYLVPGNIIVVKPNHSQARQPFRINEVKKSFSNNIQVNANHISYDLSGYPVRAAATYTNLASVISAMNSMAWSTGSAVFHQFSFDTDMTGSATFNMAGVQSLRSWMGGQEGSIIDIYGGEWEYDNFNCYLLQRRGRDTGIRISYGKNLGEYERQRDYSEYSHVCAYWKKSDVTVYSDLVATGLSSTFRCAYVDASNDYEDQPTVSQLNSYATTKISGMNMLPQTLTITPAQIGNDVIGLGDSVLVCYESVITTRVIKTVWDALAGSYKSMQLGAKKANISDTIKALTIGPSGSSESGGGGGGYTPVVEDWTSSMISGTQYWRLNSGTTTRCWRVDNLLFMMAGGSTTANITSATSVPFLRVPIPVYQLLAGAVHFGGSTSFPLVAIQDHSGVQYLHEYAMNSISNGTGLYFWAVCVINAT